MYVDKGNDIQTLIEAFEKIKDINNPIVLHINTLKGKGYPLAQENQEKFHAMPPFDLKTGKPLVDHSHVENYSVMTGNYLLDQMAGNPEIVAITSATPMVIGFFPEQRKIAGKQFMDVGIAEEHAVAFASGLAKSGVKPIYGVYGTFLQRAYDQLSEDLCMNNNPALILVFLTGVYGIPDESHQSFFDIIEISDIPNMVYLAPICKEEYMQMLAWGINQNQHPVAIRVPTNGVQSMNLNFDKDYNELNRFMLMEEGSKIAIIAVGSFYQLGEKVARQIQTELGIKVTLINPRFLTGVDSAMLDHLEKEHQLVVTIEDGIIEGGYGEKIANYYGTSSMKVINLGFKKEFVDRYIADELMDKAGLTDKKITELIKSIL